MKSGTAKSPHGEGHNFWVEAGFTLPLHAEARAAFADVLALIDHKSLGVDVDLGFDPTTARLCEFLRERLRKRIEQEVTILLKRGDFLEARTP